MPNIMVPDNDIAKYVSYSSVSPTYRTLVFVFSKKYRTLVSSLQTVPIPKDWRCAKHDPKWKDAMKKSYLPFKRTIHGNLFLSRKEKSGWL